ncbi:hypothetical protein EYF80_057267 [Liparis tanakae]|uniref:Uncharacterized protein n=1 Tax=Liparis tanakae TaxID=230148 RepID=A0A4Z2EWF7_9TELE|nr:hypothetical protein EYF80_057267 [Liparis tanakae]
MAKSARVLEGIVIADSVSIATAAEARAYALCSRAFAAAKRFKRHKDEGPRFSTRGAEVTLHGSVFLTQRMFLRPSHQTKPKPNSQTLRFTRVTTRALSAIRTEERL